MTKKLISAALVGLAVAAAAPAFAATGNVWEQKVIEMGGTLNPFILPSQQVRDLRESNKNR